MTTNVNKQDYCQENASATGLTAMVCQKVISQIAQAKRHLVEEFRAHLKGHEAVLRMALSEAEALAWQTNYPQLVFPMLAMEKAQAAATWQNRQQALNRHR